MHWDPEPSPKLDPSRSEALMAKAEALGRVEAERSRRDRENGKLKFFLGSTLMAAGSIIMSGYSLPGYGGGLSEQFPELQSEMGAIISAFGSAAAITAYFTKDLVCNLIKSKDLLPREMINFVGQIEQESARLFSAGEKGFWYVLLPNQAEPKIISEAEMAETRKELTELGIPVVDLRPRRGGAKSLLLGRGPVTQIVATRTLAGKPYGDPCVAIYDILEDLTFVEKSQCRTEGGKIVNSTSAQDLDFGPSLAAI